jgi:uncharacterized protein YjbI with pentapeptide repeats
LARNGVDGADFTGLPLSLCQKLSDVRAARSDFAGSSWANVWLEKSRFLHCSFEAANFRGIKDHGNLFLDCEFIKSSFRHAAIGYSGTRFRRCRFDRVSFRGAVFVRPTFEECEFIDCEIAGLDFEASRFFGCRFVGSLRDVWFRASYAYGESLRRFGAPEGEPILRVDFTEAELSSVDFGGGLDLSEVRLPKRGEYFLFDRWPARLNLVRAILPTLSRTERQEAEVFLRIHTPTGGQTQTILSRLELADMFGLPLADTLLAALGQPIRSSSDRVDNDALSM